jgi:Dolichyl-phosphate-mannose-protein mannosyltransferase
MSTFAYGLANKRVPGLWIMPDEAIYADRAIRLWQDGSLSVFRGPGAGYGLLYPVLAGPSLVLDSLSSLQLLQAFVMSLTAVPVFLYGRRLMPPAYALLAATLTLGSPLLLYSGFVMTEALFYPLAALTLLAITRAVETGAVRDQTIALALIAAAIATRTQAVVFVAVLAAAALLDSAVARDRSRLRSFWPTWLTVLVAALVTVTAPGVFGSYAGTLSGGYPIAASLRLTYEHLAYLALSTAILPFAALGVLGVEALRGRNRDCGERALLIVTVCATAAVCAQVGFFAARFAPHLLGRDLASLPPLLFLVFALWLARGLPRGRWVALPVCFAVLALLALTPWNKLVVIAALPDSFDTALVYRLSAHVDAATIVTLAGVALLACFAVVPRQAALALSAVMLTLLVATSVSASTLIVPLARADEQALLGSPRDWVDRVIDSDATYLYDGEPEWNSVWQQRFWNKRLAHVLTFPPTRVPGPMVQQAHAPTPSGLVAIRDRYAVATDRYTFFGTPVAHHTRGVDLEPLTLWRLAAPARLSTVTTGFLPNGDLVGPGTVTAYSCAGGNLELTLLPKDTDVVTVTLDGAQVLRRGIAGLRSWHGAIPVPASHKRTCHFTIKGGPLLGSTVVAFQRP